MRRLVWAGLFAVAGVTAWAAGYDDYLRATQMLRVGQPAQAIPLFTSALNASDLAPNYQPSAYTGRGRAYLWTRQCALALADADAALKLRADFDDALYLRSNVHQCLGHPDAALADLDRLIVLNPAQTNFFSRGFFHWTQGHFTQAAADFTTAATVRPRTTLLHKSHVYALLWSAITEARAKTFDAAGFAARAKPVDYDGWPGPLADYFLGKIKVEEVYRKAGEGEGKLAIEYKCEADFFIAQKQIAAADPAGLALLKSVAQTCPDHMMESHAAHVDLKRLP